MVFRFGRIKYEKNVKFKTLCYEKGYSLFFYFLLQKTKAIIDPKAAGMKLRKEKRCSKRKLITWWLMIRINQLDFVIFVSTWTTARKLFIGKLFSGL